MPPFRIWVTLNDINWPPFIQKIKQANRVVEMLMEISCGKSEGTLTLGTHVITLARVKITESYWSSLRDTLTHEEQRITLSSLSSDKITTNYCSTLGNTRLLNWGKNPRQLGHQQSRSSKLKAAASQRFDKIIVRVRRYNSKSKARKPQKGPKPQVFEL